MTLLSASLTFVVGLVVFFNNKKNAANRILFLLTIFAGLWTLLLFFRYSSFPTAIVNLSREANFILAKLGYASSTIVMFSLLLFSFYFPRDIKKGLATKIILFASPVFIEALVWSNQIVCGMDSLNGRWVIKYCEGNTLFAAYFFIFLMWAFINFIKNYRQVDHFEKLQIKYLLLGFFLTFFCLSFTNLILPQFFGIYGGYQLRAGPIASVFFSFFAAYAVVKHQLLEIRVIIRRATVSAVVIGAVSGLIAATSFLGNFLATKIPGFSSWMVPVFAGLTAFFVGTVILKKFKDVEKIKYEFITVAAHKFRTPLTEIKWAAKALSETETDPEKKKYIERITTSGNNLIGLAGYLLEAAETEAKEYSYKLEQKDLREIIGEQVKNIKQSASGKKREVETLISEDPIIVKIDKERISSVAQVMIDNALLYSKNKIKIDLKKEHGWAIFSVSDDGIGVTKEDIDKIFSKFYRTKKAMLVETEGAGLGLHIARGIIERHGGKIGADSAGENQGSTFWFKLRAI